MRPAPIVLSVVIFLLVFIPFMPGTMAHNPSSSYTTTVPVRSNSLASLEIGDNSAFALYGFTGNGTESNPYVLENQDVFPGFHIYDTSAWFVIRNCHIVDDLSFDNVSNGDVEHCNVDAFVHVSALHAQNIIVSNNVFKAPQDPTAGESFEPLSFRECRESTISQNEFQSCQECLRIILCNSTHVSDNKFLNCSSGISLDSSPYTAITGNEFTCSGIDLLFLVAAQSQSYSLRELVDLPYNITNNLVNGKEIGFFHNQLNLEVNSAQYGQVILLNCNSTLVTNGDFQMCSTGIQVRYCNNCTIEGSTVSDCYRDGIDIQSCPNITLLACHIANCYHGSGIDIQSSTGATLRACYITSCYTGVYLTSSPFTTIMSCTIEYSGGYGMEPRQNSCNVTVLYSIIRGNDVGLYLSNGAISIGNTVTRNLKAGIDIFGSYCLICNNTITHNNSTGIYIQANEEGLGEYNQIYNNSIGWNTFANVIDRCGHNFWDDGSSIGNSWSDYYGIGAYQIGNVGVDHYPRILPSGSFTSFQLTIVLCFCWGAVLVTAIWLKRKPTT